MLIKGPDEALKGEGRLSGRLRENIRIVQNYDIILRRIDKTLFIIKLKETKGSFLLIFLKLI